jgi:8-oxo-dGTP pyrophosphatase MutT (NUDIX family)
MSPEQARHLPFAALPYRRRPDTTVEIMLITSRDTGRWLIPKGWPAPGIEPAEAAAREAYEEGGLARPRSTILRHLVLSICKSTARTDCVRQLQNKRARNGRLHFGR